jgi:phosphoenolpyruvate carboxykinase (ATP)
MQYLGVNPSRYGLEHHGIQNVNQVFWNLGTAALMENAIRRREGLLASGGALVVRTGQRTGRSPNDKFLVKEPTSERNIWWGPVNRPFPEERFNALYGRLLGYLQGSELFVQDCFVGADPEYQIPIRVITEYAWHNLFARQLFIRPDWTKTQEHVPHFTIINVPRFHAEPEADGTHSEAFVIVHFGKGLVVIGGTSYAGEMKKSVFTILNYLLPLQGVLSMHCAANMGANGDVALFFGLSGTGKTTLSADPTRRLIGDDEHGWSPRGIFNFEGGCYAKCIRLSEEKEPQIYHALGFGSVLENVKIDPETRLLDFEDASFTENTRAAYRVRFIENAVLPSLGGHPRHIMFLTCDAFGVLPPIARLTPEQAMYHFLSGYTARVAGVETVKKGESNEPEATFSTCFGAPFLALPPNVYARMLGEKMARHQVTCWLVNTGWTGGSGGSRGQGKRMDLPLTRALVDAALEGRLNDVPYAPDPIFGIHVPQVCPEVPTEILNPRNTWADPRAFETQARMVARLFADNFAQFQDVSEEIRAAGPRVD